MFALTVACVVLKAAGTTKFYRLHRWMPWCRHGTGVEDCCCLPVVVCSLTTPVPANTYKYAGALKSRHMLHLYLNTPRKQKQVTLTPTTCLPCLVSTFKIAPKTKLHRRRTTKSYVIPTEKCVFGKTEGGPCGHKSIHKQICTINKFHLSVTGLEKTRDKQISLTVFLEGGIIPCYFAALRRKVSRSYVCCKVKPWCYSDPSSDAVWAQTDGSLAIVTLCTHSFWRRLHASHTNNFDHTLYHMDNY